MSLQALLTSPALQTIDNINPSYTMSGAWNTPGICVFPVSPTLLPLHRLLYYLSLALAVLYPTPPPIIKGAFAYSLTTSAIAAIYSIILALPQPQGITNRNPQNLDVLPLWSVMATAAISLPMFLLWNRNVTPRYSPVRPIVRIWGLLVTFGAACAFVNIRQIYGTASYADGDPTNATLEQCRALNAGRTLRDIRHVQLIAPWFLSDDAMSKILSVTPALTFIPVAVGALACLFTLPTKNQDATTMSAPEMTISDDLLDNRTSRAFKLVLEVYDPIRKLILWCCPAFWIAVVALNENFFLHEGEWALGTYSTEKMFEVGQWGVWAGLGLVMLAGMVDYITGKKRPSPKVYTREGDEGVINYGGVGQEV